MAQSKLHDDLVRMWLAQFEEHDRNAAAKLLAAVKFVSDGEFRSGLTSLLGERLDAGLRPVALYNEVEIPLRKGIPHRLFKEHRRKVRRACGTSPALVPRRRYVDEEVGSEGIVANIITQFRKTRKRLVTLSPGPDTIRKRQFRRLILVTDFIGSGDRMLRFLEAAWRVRSVRSWWSRRAGKGWSFEVVAYAGLPSGIDRVESHPSKPLVVTTGMTVPTIRSEFLTGEARQIENLCRRYLANSPNPLGYGNCAALIAFGHSMPNNAPGILWRQNKGWRPLFPGRTTTGMAKFFDAGLDATAILVRIKSIWEQLKSPGGLTSPVAREVPSSLEKIVLAALRRPQRNANAISGRLGLDLAAVTTALENLRDRAWISDGNQITERGRIALERLEGSGESKLLPPSDPGYYYPKMLRAPRDV